MFISTHTQQLQQNNPILYIFLGESCKDLCLSIRSVQSQQIGSLGMAYINVDERCTVNDLIELLKDAHNHLMQKQYLYAGEIRINYILDAHDQLALSFEELKEKTEQFLSFLYPVGILSDVYALIDDKQAALQRQHQVTADVIEMLEAVSSNISMVYLLSNVSRDAQNDEVNNIIYSVALIALVKDFVPLKPENNINNYYNEDYFKKDSFKNNKGFVSIGYANIKKPSEIIKGTILTKLLNYMEGSDFNIDLHIPLKKINSIAKVVKALEKENLMGIGMNPRHGVKNTTNIQAIELLFNSRLSLYYELNLSVEASYDTQLQQLAFSLEELANRKEAGFFAVYDITAQEGALLDELRQLQAENKNILSKLKNDYLQWCNDKTRAGLSETQCFDLAKQYLEWKRAIDEAEEIAEYYEHLKRFIVDYHKTLEAMKKHIDSMVADNQRHVSVLESALPFVNHSISSFYEKLLFEYLEDNNQQYADLYGKLYGCLKEYNFKKYVNMLSGYIDNTLLKEEIFNKPITEEATDILCFNQISEDKVYSYIFDWIAANKRLNIFLKTGDKHLHSEINILVDVDSKLMSKPLSNKEHINFFYNNNENEIHILYHTGGFVKEELYYWELYNGEAVV